MSFEHDERKTHKTRVARLISAFATFAFGLIVSPSVLAIDYTASLVEQLEPPSLSYDCVFFKLAGITQADPYNPGSPWFAVPRAHPGFREVFAVLLGSQKSGTTVWVRTTGTGAPTVCGAYVTVDFVVSNAN